MSNPKTEAYIYPNTYIYSGWRPLKDERSVGEICSKSMSSALG